MKLTAIAPWRLSYVMAALVLLGTSYGAEPARGQNARCVQTGDESVGPDKPHYRPDEVARIAGNGFPARCDVGVRVLAPDGTIATAVVSTSDAGDFAFDHLLGDLDGEYTVTLLGSGDAVVSELTFTNGPVVALDKGDYRNNETVHVTGEGYVPFEPLTVQVTRPDGSIVTGDGTETPGSDAVTTDADGKFAYDYIIRNGVRADYLVDVLDASGASVAATSFTDSAAFVQNLGTNNLVGNSLTTSISVTVTGTVTAGNSIIVGFAGTQSNINAVCSDSKGNTYTTDATRANVSGIVSICSTHGIAPAKVLVPGDTITVTFTAGGSNRSVSANEFSGLESAGALDRTQTGVSVGATTAPSSGLTAATTQADEVLFGAIWFSGTNNASFTAGSGACTGTPNGPYTLTNAVIGNGLGGGTVRPLATEYRIATVTGQYAACGTLTMGNVWAAAIATYKASAGPKLTVTKTVDNTGGGTKAIADFPLFVDGNPVTSGVQITTTPGAHTVSETTDPDYTAVIGGDCAADGSITLGAADVKTCTITNTFKAPKLTVNKSVVNTGGGTKAAGDFPLFVDGNPVTNGVQITTSVGAHTVSETIDPNYTAVISGDCAADGSITLAAGDVKSCTITNTFKAPKLTVNKSVVNTGGGTKAAGDFPLFVDGNPVTNGVQITTTTGAHTVSETVDPNYTAVISGDCAANGSITLAAGDVKSCTITNTFNAPKLTVNKSVVNTGGGTKQPSDFPLFVDGNPVTNGVQITTTVGSHTVSETTDPAYTAVISGDCAANGSITLAAGDVKSCTITNTFNTQATLIVVKQVINTMTGTKVPGDFTMQVTGSGASPSSFPGSSSGTTVTLNAGAYSVSELPVAGYFASFSANCSGTIASGETRTCTVTNSDSRLAPYTFCSKAAVTSVLNPSGGRFPGNAGVDHLVRVDLGESIQSAVDSVVDANGDGYIIVGVIANGTGALGGQTNQRLTINRAYTLPFGLVGCSVTMRDPNRVDGQPTARITSSASSPTPPSSTTNIFVMDLHANDSDAAGWLVEGNGRELRNVSVASNATGFSVVGDSNTLHNAIADNNRGIGISVQGNNNILDTPNVTKNASHGIQVIGNSNQVIKALAGDKSKGNLGDGIRVNGVGNIVHENRANANGGAGFDVRGGSAGFPNRLKNNLSNSASSGTENGGGEYVLQNFVRSEGGNKADSIVVPKTSAPVKCPTFPANNATVNFASQSVCE